jgi:hypothetical protein
MKKVTCEEPFSTKNKNNWTFYYFFLMASNIYSLASPLVFSSEIYQIWVVWMKTYLQVYDFWDVVEQEHDP